LTPEDLFGLSEKNFCVILPFIYSSNKSYARGFRLTSHRSIGHGQTRLILGELTKELQQIFESYGTESYLSVSNTPFVQERIEKLKLELDDFKDAIFSTQSSPVLDIIEKYSSKYSLQSFSDWFVKWGQKMLRNYHLIRREKICSTRGVKGRTLFPEHTREISTVSPSDDQECKEISKRGADCHVERIDTEVFEIVPKSEVDLPSAPKIVTKPQRKRPLNSSRLVSKKKREEARVEQKDVCKEPTDPLEAEVNLILDEESEEGVKVQAEKGGILMDFRKEVWSLFSPLET
jgi:hypothetical protein